MNLLTTVNISSNIVTETPQKNNEFCAPLTVYSLTLYVLMSCNSLTCTNLLTTQSAYN